MTPKIMIVASKIPPDQILRYQPPPRAEEKRLHLFGKHNLSIKKHP
jgi:hypothetical protein